MDVRRRSAIAAMIFWGLTAFLQPRLEALELQGRVRMAAPYPEKALIKVAKKPGDPFPAEQLSERLIVSGDGGVKNAALFLTGKGLEASGKGKAVAVLDQKDYHFNPHVLVLPPDQAFQILNSDPMAHDVRAFAGPKMLFRLDMDTGHPPVEKRWDQPGVYVIRCGLHHWMNAYVIQAVNSYYAVTDPSGSFQIENIPAGRYRLRIWHESLGEADVPVEIQNSISNFSYTFNPRSDL